MKVLFPSLFVLVVIHIALGCYKPESEKVFNSLVEAESQLNGIIRENENIIKMLGKKSEEKQAHREILMELSAHVSTTQSLAFKNKFNLAS
jgi:hypothetical protein